MFTTKCVLLCGHLFSKVKTHNRMKRDFLRKNRGKPLVTVKSFQVTLDTLSKALR